MPDPHIPSSSPTELPGWLGREGLRPEGVGEQCLRPGGTGTPPPRTHRDRVPGAGGPGAARRRAGDGRLLPVRLLRSVGPGMRRDAPNPTSDRLSPPPPPSRQPATCECESWLRRAAELRFVVALGSAVLAVPIRAVFPDPPPSPLPPRAAFVALRGSAAAQRPHAAGWGRVPPCAPPPN